VSKDVSGGKLVKSHEFNAVKDYLQSLQDAICLGLEAADGSKNFLQNLFPSETGMARPRVLENGKHIEKAAVNFSHSTGASLPPAATARKPALAGKAFEAVSLSLIVHPKNPYAPTCHANLRAFRAYHNDDVAWWFGGGFDLTPYYGFEEDAKHWHQTSKKACQPFGEDVYPLLKKQCDEYFFLKHRQEARGIGGLFFDDHNEGGFEQSFAMQRSIGDHFLEAYLPILEKRKNTEFGQRERDFQLYRRGRYVEFNLVYDRGTLYGLQSGRRIESVLCSMPPVVKWIYDHKTEPGSPEEKLTTDFLKPRDWAS
jgi:coproporphyrinogen III oxidase